METLDPSTRGCRFDWEADVLRYHSRCFANKIALFAKISSFRPVTHHLKVFSLQLPPGMRDKDSTNNIQLPSLVI